MKYIGKPDILIISPFLYPTPPLKYSPLSKFCPYSKYIVYPSLIKISINNFPALENRKCEPPKRGIILDSKTI